MSVRDLTRLSFVWLQFANKELHEFFEQAHRGGHGNDQLPFFKCEGCDAHELAEKCVPAHA
jgi:hypothetical protein